MAIGGPNSIGNIGTGGYSVLANKVDFGYKPAGVTIDDTTITAVASSATLNGGFVTTVGDKVIPAGSILYKLGNGKYGVALAATTLVVGETFVLERHWSLAIHEPQVGFVLQTGNVIQARLLVGGAAATLANVKAAIPGLRLLTD